MQHDHEEAYLSAWRSESVAEVNDDKDVRSIFKRRGAYRRLKSWSLRCLAAIGEQVT